MIILADVIRTHNPGDFEFHIINQMIDKARDFAASFADNNLLLCYNEGIRTSARDISKMVQVIARVFHIEEANNLARPPITKEEVQKFLEAALASSAHGGRTRSVLCSLLAGFLNLDNETLEQNNVDLSDVVWEWIQNDHSDFLGYARDQFRSEMNHVFRVTFHHHD